MKKQNVLFLCAHNAARSQMAEAILRKYAADQFEVQSAGLEPMVIDPMTIRVMNEIGLNLGDHVAKGLDRFMGKTSFQYAIIVCGRTQKNCPHLYPFAMSCLAWPFEDPAAHQGTEAERMQKFRDVRDAIEARILEWLRQPNKPERHQMKEPAKEKLHYHPKEECGHGNCLGELFPDFLHLTPNVLNRGRVFSVLIESFGIGVQRKKIVRDEVAWRKCQECPDFDRCLQVSVANLSLQQAVTNY